MVDEKPKVPAGAIKKETELNPQQLLEQMNAAQARLEQESKKHDQALIARYDQAQSQYRALEAKVEATAPLLAQAEAKVAGKKEVAKEYQDGLNMLQERINEAHGGMVQLNEEIQALAEEPAVKEELARRDKEKEEQTAKAREYEERKKQVAMETAKRKQERGAQLEKLLGVIDKVIADYADFLESADYQWLIKKEWESEGKRMWEKMKPLKDQRDDRAGLLKKKQMSLIGFGKRKLEKEIEDLDTKINDLAIARIEIDERYNGILREGRERRDAIGRAVRDYKASYDVSDDHYEKDESGLWMNGVVSLRRKYPYLRIGFDGNCHPDDEQLLKAVREK